MPMIITSQISKSVDLTKTKTPDISRTKHYFFFKSIILLSIIHQGLLYGKNSFVVEVNFKDKKF